MPGRPRIETGNSVQITAIHPDGTREVCGMFFDRTGMRFEVEVDDVE